MRHFPHAINCKLSGDIACVYGGRPHNCYLMKIFTTLRDIIRLERRHLPFIETIEDRDIVSEIGFHETRSDRPLALKQIYLLDIGSAATVQRRVTRLVNLGVVVKQRHKQDGRVFTLHLSAATKREYQRLEAALLN